MCAAAGWAAGAVGDGDPRMQALAVTRVQTTALVCFFNLNLIWENWAVLHRDCKGHDSAMKARCLLQGRRELEAFRLNKSGQEFLRHLIR